MRRVHAAAIAVILGVAAAAGGIAVTSGAGAGPDRTDPAAVEREIARREARIEAAEAALARALARRPPAPVTPGPSTAPGAAAWAHEGEGEREHGDDHEEGDHDDHEGGEDDGWDD
jgi:hypothetical protein